MSTITTGCVADDWPALQLQQETPLAGLAYQRPLVAGGGFDSGRSGLLAKAHPGVKSAPQ